MERITVITKRARAFYSRSPLGKEVPLPLCQLTANRESPLMVRKTAAVGLASEFLHSQK